MVTVSRLERNPTVKNEIKEKGFKTNIPAGFLIYPVSQAADTTAFLANYIPTGEDQLPVTEQGREIVRTFNNIYGDVLVEAEGVLADSDKCYRLPGIDGKGKMSKSLGNAIYLSDDTETVRKKVFDMYTDPNHITIDMPGHIEGNMVFTYLDAFAENEHFKKFLPNDGYTCLDDLKEHYKKGGLGDAKIKKFLFNIIEDILTPIREKRRYYELNIDEVIQILKDGSKKAREVAAKTLKKVRTAMGIEYFEDDALIDYYKNKFHEHGD